MINVFEHKKQDVKTTSNSRPERLQSVKQKNAEKIPSKAKPQSPKSPRRKKKAKKVEDDNRRNFFELYIKHDNKPQTPPKNEIKVSPEIAELQSRLGELEKTRNTDRKVSPAIADLQSRIAKLERGSKSEKTDSPIMVAKLQYRVAELEKQNSDLRSEVNELKSAFSKMEALFTQRADDLSDQVNHHTKELFRIFLKSSQGSKFKKQSIPTWTPSNSYSKEYGDPV